MTHTSDVGFSPESSSKVLLCSGLSQCPQNPHSPILPFQILLLTTWSISCQRYQLLSGLTLRVLAQVFPRNPLSSLFPNKVFRIFQGCFQNSSESFILLPISTCSLPAFHLYAPVGAQGELSQNSPQWHLDYFGLKLLDKRPVHEGHTDPPLSPPR